MKIKLGEMPTSNGWEVLGVVEFDDGYKKAYLKKDGVHAIYDASFFIDERKVKYLNQNDAEEALKRAGK